MTDAERIARDLTDGTDMAAAAVLVAMCEDSDVIAGRAARYLSEKLEELGCLDAGSLTPLGRAVGKALQGMGVHPMATT